MNVAQVKSEYLTPERVAQIQAFMNEGFRGEKIERTFSPENFIRTYKTLLESGIGVLFLLLDGDRVEGLIGGAVSPDVLSTRVIAAETSWRVSSRGKGQGMNLLLAFEIWAEFWAGADAMVVHTRADRSERLKLQQKLVSRGYEMSGYQYMKQFSKPQAEK